MLTWERIWWTERLNKNKKRQFWNRVIRSMATNDCSGIPLFAFLLFPRALWICKHLARDREVFASATCLQWTQYNLNEAASHQVWFSLSSDTLCTLQVAQQAAAEFCCLYVLPCPHIYAMEQAVSGRVGLEAKHWYSAAECAPVMLSAFLPGMSLKSLSYLPYILLVITTRRLIQDCPAYSWHNISLGCVEKH